MPQTGMQSEVSLFGRMGGIAIMAIGIALIVVASGADRIGLGVPGFGWEQLLGAMIGGAITTAGITVYRAGGSPSGAWQRWRHLAAVVATWQARVLYSVVYVLLVVPIGLILRWLTDPLRLRRAAPDGTSWGERPPPPSPPTWNRSQF